MGLTESSAWRRCVLRSRDDGAKIPVYRAGSGAPLLLLHGWTLDHRSFEAQLPLGDHFELLAPDRRGYGSSPAAPDLDAELADLDTIVDELGGGTVHLLGVSQGARLALRYAATRRQCLRSLVLQGAVIDGYSPDVRDDEPIPLEQYAELARCGKLDELRRDWLAHPLMCSDPLSAAQKESLAAIVAGYSGADLLGAGSGMPVPALIDTLATTGIPTLLVTGARETAGRRAHARKLLETLPIAREIVISNAGHLSNISRAIAYNAAVRDFLGEVDSAT